MAIARGKTGSFECRCLALTTFLPTWSLANFVCWLKTADTPIYLPLSKRPNLALLKKSKNNIISKEVICGGGKGPYFFGPCMFIVKAERAREALSRGGASALSLYLTLFISKV